MSNYLSPEWRLKLLDAGFPPIDLPTGDAEEILRRFPLVYMNIGLDVDGHWAIEYTDAQNPSSGFSGSCRQDSLANAAAAMYCYLAGNKLL